MPDTLNLRQLAQARGKDIVSADGINVGHVREVIYDYATREPVWVGVGSAEAPRFRTLLVPASGATSEADHLRVSYSRAKIEDQPHADFGEGFDSLGDERHLYEYFGVSFSEASDLRVLRDEDDLPGLEQVTTE